MGIREAGTGPAARLPADSGSVFSGSSTNGARLAFRPRVWGCLVERVADFLNGFRSGTPTYAFCVRLFFFCHPIAYLLTHLLVMFRMTSEPWQCDAHLRSVFVYRLGSVLRCRISKCQSLPVTDFCTKLCNVARDSFYFFTFFVHFYEWQFITY